MPDQQQQQPPPVGLNAEGKQLVPFIIRAITGMADGLTFEDIEDEEKNTPDGPKPERRLFTWDTTHLVTRSYFIERISPTLVPVWSVDELEEWLKPQPSKIDLTSKSDKEPKVEDEEGSDEEEDEEEDYFPLYQPRQLPELTDVQVDALNTKLLSSITVFAEMRSILKAKLKTNELQQWEYEDFRQNAMNITELAKHGRTLTMDQKKWWQRHLVTNNLLWMLAIDYRYKFDLAQEHVDMLAVEQVSLIWTVNRHINHFALYPKSRVLISKILKTDTEFKLALLKATEARAAEAKRVEGKKSNQSAL